MGRGLARFLHPHVPFDQATHLAWRITTLDHALHELLVLLLGLAVLLLAETDHGQQVLDLAEHAPLDHFSDLLITGPTRILATVLGARTQRELDHFEPEVLRIGDT